MNAWCPIRATGPAGPGRRGERAGRPGEASGSHPGSRPDGQSRATWSRRHRVIGSFCEASLSPLLRPIGTGSKFYGEAVEEEPLRLAAPVFDGVDSHVVDGRAPWLVATSTQALQITSLWVRLSKRAWKRRVRSCLALR